MSFWIEYPKYPAFWNRAYIPKNIIARGKTLFNNEDPIIERIQKKCAKEIMEYLENATKPY